MVCVCACVRVSVCILVFVCVYVRLCVRVSVCVLSRHSYSRVLPSPLLTLLPHIITIQPSLSKYEWLFQLESEEDEERIRIGKKPKRRKYIAAVQQFK